MASMQSRTVMVEPSDDQELVDESELRFQKLKVLVHERLVDALDLSMLAHIPQAELEEEVRAVGAEVVAEEAPNISVDDRTRLLDELYDEVFGLGPIECLMKDDRRWMMDTS